MKKLIAPLFFALVLIVVLASCGSSQHGRCEAYGDAPVINAPAELPDISE